YIPEGVKMAAVSLMSEGVAEPCEDAYPPIGALMAFCAFGLEEFEEHNVAAASAHTRSRLERALEEGEGLDASIVLLMLHARLLHRSLKDHYGIEADEAGYWNVGRPIVAHFEKSLLPTGQNHPGRV